MPRQNDSLDTAMGSRDWKVKTCVGERLEDLLCDFEAGGFALHSIYNVMNMPMPNPIDPKQGRLISHFIVVARKKPKRSITIDHDAEEQLG